MYILHIVYWTGPPASAEHKTHSAIQCIRRSRWLYARWHSHVSYSHLQDEPLLFTI